MHSKDFRSDAYYAAMDDMRKAGFSNGKHPQLCKIQTQLQTHDVCNGALTPNDQGVYMAMGGWQSKKKGAGWHY